MGFFEHRFDLGLFQVGWAHSEGSHFTGDTPWRRVWGKLWVRTLL